MCCFPLFVRSLALGGVYGYSLRICSTNVLKKIGSHGRPAVAGTEYLVAGATSIWRGAREGQLLLFWSVVGPDALMHRRRGPRTSPHPYPALARFAFRAEFHICIYLLYFYYIYCFYHSTQNTLQKYTYISMLSSVPHSPGPTENQRRNSGCGLS